MLQHISESISIVSKETDQLIIDSQKWGQVVNVPGPPVGLKQPQLLHDVESLCHLTRMGPVFKKKVVIKQ